MASALAVNGRCLANPVSGVERYTAEITRRFNGHVRVLRPQPTARGLSGHLWEQVRLPRLIERDELLWSPANTGPLSVSRQVVTIHDLSPLEHPEWFHPRFASWYGYLLPRLARRARRVITDSLFSKSRIVELLDVREDHVVEIPLGVAGRFHPPTDNACVQDRTAVERKPPYFLVVGSLQPRKNLATLFTAWERVGFAAEEAKLLVAGASAKAFRAERFDHLPQNVELIGAVDDDELPRLYGEALGVVLASYYEGFGLPLLEAMACGAPVICSNATALPEVGGDVPLYVDPHDSDSLGQALLTLRHDGQLRMNLRMRGVLRARAFSWEDTAERVWRVLEESLQG